MIGPGRFFQRRHGSDTSRRDVSPDEMERVRSESESFEGALAEFTALRTEILHRMTMRWNIFALQLTASGVIFSFALSAESRIGFLLIIPVISYALSMRYEINQSVTEYIGKYIRDELDQHAHEELRWERHYHSDRESRSVFRTILSALLDPNFLTFTGVSVIAIVWVKPSVWNFQSELIAEQRNLQIGFMIVWWLDVVLTLLSFEFIRHPISRWLLDTWRASPR